MVRAQPAIVRASPLNRGVIDQRHLWRLDEDFSAASVVLDIISNQHFLHAMIGTPLEHEDLLILKNRLALDLAIAGRAN